jgi:hypothetical protein
MRPYWIKTDRPMSLGIGVTAQSEEDAIGLFREAFPTHTALGITVIQDMREIDQKHVAPNAGDWLRRGIWFPLGHKA